MEVACNGDEDEESVSLCVTHLFSILNKTDVSCLVRQKEKENGKSGMLMLVYSTNVHIGTRPCVIVPAVTGRRPVTLHGPVRAVFDSLCSHFLLVSDILLAA